MLTSEHVKSVFKSIDGGEGHLGPTLIPIPHSKLVLLQENVLTLVRSRHMPGCRGQRHGSGSGSELSDRLLLPC